MIYFKLKICAAWLLLVLTGDLFIMALLLRDCLFFNKYTHPTSRHSTSIHSTPIPACFSMEIFRFVANSQTENTTRGYFRENVFKSWIPLSKSLNWIPLVAASLFCVIRHLSSDQTSFYCRSFRHESVSRWEFLPSHTIFYKANDKWSFLIKEEFAWTICECVCVCLMKRGQWSIERLECQQFVWEKKYFKVYKVQSYEL